LNPNILVIQASGIDSLLCIEDDSLNTRMDLIEAGKEDYRLVDIVSTDKSVNSGGEVQSLNFL